MHSALKGRHPVWPLLALAPVLWGGNFVIGRLIAPEIPPIWLNLLRWLVAALILLPFVLPGLLRERRALIDDMRGLVLLSLLGIIGFNTTLYGALQHITASQAAIGFAFSPFVIMVISALMNARLPRPGLMVAALIAFCGVLLAYLDSVRELAPIERAGFALLVAPPVLSWSLFCVALGRLRLSSTPGCAFFAQILIGLVLQGGYAMAFGPAFPIEEIDRASIIAISYLGILASAVAFMCWQVALRHVRPEDAGVYLHLVPLSSLILAWLFLQERLGGTDLTGIALIFVGLFLTRAGTSTEAPRARARPAFRIRKES
jgi:drug/metabolite transporter (DMT)-like permease